MKPKDLTPNEFAEASGGWDQFIAWARTRRHFVFRGQSNSTWPVWSSYHRYMHELGDSSEERTMLQANSEYRIALDVAAHELYPELEEKFDLKDCNELMEFLSVAQHHGFPTPLIDFTYSPYIAAYFAVRDAKEGQSCRIFCVNQVALQIGIGGDRNSRVKFVWPLARHNPRISVQQGLFILSLTSDFLRHLTALSNRLQQNNYIRPSPATDKPLVSGFLLKVSNKEEILSDLDLMGINEYSLFGGLDGAFRYQKWKRILKNSAHP